MTPPGRAVGDPAARSWREDSLLDQAWPIAAILAFTAVLLWPLISGRRLYWGDIALYFDPMTAFARTSLQHGELPLWNPYILLGQPYLGNPQAPLLYPFTAVLPHAATWWWINADVVLHTALLGCFTYLYLCRWVLRRTSALAGALVLIGSDCVLGRLQFPPMVRTLAYFPLLLIAVDRWLDHGNSWALLLFAASICLAVLAAHAQVAYLVFAVVAVYAMLRAFSAAWGAHDCTGRAKLARAVMLAVPLALAATLGLCMAAAHLIPAVGLLVHSPREHLTAAQSNRFYLDPPMLLQLVAPRFFGHPATRDYWGAGNAWEPAIWIGWAPVALVGYALLRCGRERLVRFWAVSAAGAIWLAMGTSGGLYWLAYWLVPGISNFHDPARFLIIAVFALAVLTAIGVDSLRVRRGWFSRRGAALILAAIATPLWWTGRDWNPAGPPAMLDGVRSRRDDSAREMAPRQEPFWRRFVNEGYLDYSAISPESMREFLATDMPNLPMARGGQSASGYEPVPISGNLDLDTLCRQELKRGEPGALSLLRLMSVSDISLPVGDVLPQHGAWLKDVRGPTAVWIVPSPMSDAWIVRSVRLVPTRKRALAALGATDFRPSDEAIVESSLPPRWIRSLGTAARNVPSSARAAVQCNAVHIICSAGPAAGLLVYSGTAFPGWSALVDGRSASLVATDCALLGTPIGPGNHRVELRYAPNTFRIGLYTSLCAVVLWCWGAGRELRCAVRRAGESRCAPAGRTR